MREVDSACPIGYFWLHGSASRHGQYPQALVPAVICIKSCKKWWIMGLVFDEKKQSRRNIVTDIQILSSVLSKYGVL
jgi:hypothetical protein